MTYPLTGRDLGWATLTSSILLFSACSCAWAEVPLVVTPTAHKGPSQDQIAPLQQATVVYLGEHHDSVADHQIQLAIIQALYATNPDLAIGMEMFQRPFQSVLDRYLVGEISEQDLVAQTEYEQRWGFPWEYYEPILRFARDHQLPVLALNAPSETVHQVARAGLDSLNPEDFRYIPPRSAIDTSNLAYRTFVNDAMGAVGSHSSYDLDNFFAAQVVWDETMAATIAEFKQAHPDTQIVVLAGSGHVIYGYGIPDRVARRLGDGVSQVTVLLNVPPEFADDPTNGMADVLWYGP